MNDSADSSLRFQISPLLFLVGIFFLNFLGRIILSPLMPAVEKDLKIGHDEAGSLFLIISLGYCVGLLASGFVSSRLSHRKTIFLSSIAVGFGLMIVSLSHNLWAIRSGLIFLGMAAGFYLPSGIATVTELVRPEHWGKAIAIHELAPNLGYVIAPLLAEALLGLFSWRGVLSLAGVGSIIAGAVFILWGKGGTFPGEAPDSKTLRFLLTEPSFWIMIALFGLGIGASLGVYAMMPLYLVTERGMDRTWANTLVGSSRVLTMGSAILTGMVTDRIGPQKTLMGVFLAGGIVTMLVGLIPGSWIIPIVFLQSMLATAFFPPGFAALNRIGSGRIRNVAVSLTVPFGFLLGGGAIAAGIGVMGEIRSFAFGITFFGGLLFVGVFLANRLKFTKDLHT
jgi:NNP family nitrate/nitrite transporter-like MFS transporter